MKKTFAKYLSLALIPAVLITLFSSCKKANSGTVSSNTVSYPVTQASKNLYANLKGTTVQIIGFSDPDQNTKALNTAFEQYYGCKVDYQVFGWNEWQQKFVQMVSAGNPPDQCLIFDSTFLSSVSKGLLQPVTGYIDTAAPEWDSKASKVFTWDNKQYCAVGSNQYDGIMIYYNKTMFQNAGEKEPIQYYNEGDWNFTNFRKVAKDMTQDTNHDGKVDQLGFGTWIWNVFCLANGGTTITVDGTTIKPTWNSPNELAGYQLMEDMSCTDKSFRYSVDWLSMFKAGQMAMVAERPWNVMGVGQLSTTMKDEVGVCPVPQGPNVTTPYCPTIMQAYGIPKGAKNPLGGGAYTYFANVYAAVHSKDSANAATTNNYLPSDQKTMIDAYMKKATPIDSFIEGLGDWTASKKWTFYKEILVNDLPPAEAVAKCQGFIQGLIDQTISGTSANTAS